MPSSRFDYVTNKPHKWLPPNATTMDKQYI